MACRLRTGVLLLLGLLPGVGLHAQRVPAPSEVLGIAVGADSVLADWSQIGQYMATLANTSAYVRLDTIGATGLGRPLLMVTLTAPHHMQRLEEIRQAQTLLADPRRLTAEQEDSLVRAQPAVVFINNNIHSTEIASSQFSMMLAHRLATEPRYRAMLEHMVVLMTPSANPDGQDTVVKWYRQYKGTAYESGPLPWLYQAYVGHDNNRDWYMLTQPESKTIARVLYREWFPEIVWDVHQMGARGPRFFLPPFANPVNPNLDPILVEATNFTGAAMASAVYDAGKTGVIHQMTFDLWWHGGFRTVPARHNMIGVLSEAASARLASPTDHPPDTSGFVERGVNYPQPWTGGRWSLGDIIEYELLAADGLLRLVATQREQFVRRFVSLGRRAIAAGEAGHPFAYVIPPDQDDPWAATVLANALLDAGVEVRRATTPFQADGTRYPPGTLVVPMAQPARAHAKDLLEIQTYPDRRLYPGGPPVPPYDVAGWTLPLQMGLSVPEIAAPFEVATERVQHVGVTGGRVHGTGRQWVLANRGVMESRTIADALHQGAHAWVTATSIAIDGTTLPPGSVVLENGRDPEALAAVVAWQADSFGFDVWGTDGLRPAGRVVERLPRIGLYKPWTASMDEGWTRWVLEQHGIPFTTVTDAMIRDGSLERRFDVLLLPDLSDSSIVYGRSVEEVPSEYAGGVGETGAEHVAEFVQRGGVLVTLDGSGEFAIARLRLPVQRGLPPEDSAPSVFAPGSIFEVALEPGSALTSGMRNTAFVYITDGMVFDVDAPARVVGRFVDNPLRSGYGLNQERLGGKPALVDVGVGNGRAILFGFRPQHRGQPYGTFKLLFNALLLSGRR